MRCNNMKVYGVRFKIGGKAYNFSSTTDYKMNDKVIVETERGAQLGEIAEIKDNCNYKDLKEIVRPATDEDYEIFLKNTKESQKALAYARKLIKDRNINMNLIDSSFSLDKKVLLFNFISDERVDFRDLVKDLAGKYHTRIELHQMGVRDKAREIGGIGQCGRVLCCNGCMKNVNTVNINMIKNQNIALNPTKINGACGRLLCCFTYENDMYEENRKVLPKIGEKVNYNGKQAVVTDLDILNKKYTVKIDENTFESVNVE